MKQLALGVLLFHLNASAASIRQDDHAGGILQPAPAVMMAFGLAALVLGKAIRR
jgi:hypothetical protein